MKTGYGFKEFETTDEFKSWLNSQNVSRDIYRLQVHHMFLPDYDCWKKDNALRRQHNIKDYHIKTNGWDDIAQHFSIFPDGHIVTGRGLNKTPIGIRGWNTGAICIEIYGNFDTDKMTKVQQDAIIACYALLAKRFNVPINSNGIRPHCWFTTGGTYLGDFSRSQSCKTCPGTKFFGGNTKAAFDKYFYPAIKNYGTGTPQPPQPPETEDKPDQLTGKYIVRFLQTTLNDCYGTNLAIDGSYGPATKNVVKDHYLKQGCTGGHVMWLQKALVNRGYDISIDGSFGPATLNAVKAYQKSRGLNPDGYAGLDTHTKIIND